MAPPSMQFSVPKDDKKSGGTSVLDKPVVDTSPKTDDKLGKDKMYHVLLFNDVRYFPVSHIQAHARTKTHSHRNLLLLGLTEEVRSIQCLYICAFPCT